MIFTEQRSQQILTNPSISVNTYFEPYSPRNAVIRHSPTAYGPVVNVFIT